MSFTDDASHTETRTSAATAVVTAAATTPTISAVAVTSTPQLETDTYGEGEEIQFTVAFSEAVTVTGMPQFVFSLGNAGDTRRVNAGYDAAASTDTELVFAYTVVSTDEDDNGIFILDDATVSGTAGSGSIVLGLDGSIVGKTSEVPASLAHSVRGAQSGHKVDGSHNTPATGAPTITGTAQVGETLTAVTTGISDADGLTSPTYIYQWIRVNGTEADIAGATSSAYTLVDADLGTTIKVRVSFQDDDGNPETRTSAATATVVAKNTPATGAPTITGTAQVGETLTAVTTGIMDETEGLDNVSYMYQWIRVDGTDADIAGATSSTYTLVDADLGTTIKVRVTFTDDDGNAETLTSAATATVVAKNTPDTTAPTVSRVEITSLPGPDVTYAAGEVIELTVTFSETVEVTGTPQLRLRVGSRTRTAGYLRGTDTAALVFGYEVVEGDEDTDGVSMEANSLTRNVGTIRDEARNNAELDHDGLAADSGHKVDGVKPRLAATGGAVVNGTTLTLTYDEPLDGSFNA